MLVCRILILEANIKQSLFKLLLDRTEREPEVFISSTTGKNESLHHRQGQVVIVLTCGRELVGIFAEVNGQLLEIFAWVLTWKASLDRSLEIFEPFDGCRLDGLEELKPDDWKGIVVVELSATLLLRSIWSDANKKVLAALSFVRSYLLYLGTWPSIKAFAD